MAITGDVEFGYATLQYHNEIEAVPTTSKTTGNVTVNNMGSPGVPAYFAATFMISAEFEQNGVRTSNIFHWNAIVSGMEKDAPYGEVESEAARQLAPMLRAVADSIEKQVAEYDARRAQRGAE